MDRVIQQLLKEFDIKEDKMKNLIQLLGDGNEIPYITRYQRDKTGIDNPDIIFKFNGRLTYLRNLYNRQDFVSKKLKELNLWDANIEKQIRAFTELARLNEFYELQLPVEDDPVTIAIEKGLKPLADAVLKGENIEEELEKLQERKDLTEAEVEEGVSQIVYRNIISDDKYLEKSTEVAEKYNKIEVKIKEDREDLQDLKEGFSKPVEAPSHRILKLMRAKKNKEVDYEIIIDDETIKKEIDKMTSDVKSEKFKGLKKALAEEAYSNYFRTRVIAKIRKDIIEKAEDSAITTFETNLRNLLMQAPLQEVRVLGFDPGITNGCKLAVIDENGSLVGHDIIYILGHKANIEKAFTTMDKLLDSTKFNIIALGNGTAVTEAEQFIQEWLTK